MSTTALPSIQTLLTMCFKRSGVCILSLDLDRLRGVARMLKVASKEGVTHSKAAQRSPGSLKKTLAPGSLSFYPKRPNTLRLPRCEEAQIPEGGSFQVFPLRNTAEVLGSWNYLQAYERGYLHIWFSPINHQSRSLQWSGHHGKVMSNM